MQSPRWKGSYLNTGVITRMEGYSPGWRVSQLDGGVINSKEKGNQEKQSGCSVTALILFFLPEEHSLPSIMMPFGSWHTLASDMIVEDTQGKANWHKQYTKYYIKYEL